MAKFLILSACLALSSAAPTAPLAGAWAGLGAAPLAAPFAHAGGIVGTHVVPGPVAVHEQLHHGAPVEHRRTITGVVGHRQVQVGTQAVQVGHEFHQTGAVSNARPSFQVVASPATNVASTRALPLPALPAPAAPGPIPAPAFAWGPAPADAVTTVAVKAPVRTHTVITPKLHRIEPELQVNKVPYDVPVPNPVPVERVVVHTQHVPKPYEVAVPRAVPVPQPYKVHPVQRIVETPVIHKKTTTVHQPVVHTAVAQRVIAHAAVAPVAHAAHIATPFAAAAPIAAAPLAGAWAGAAPLAAPIAAAPLAGAWAGAAPLAGAALPGWAGAFPGLIAAKA